VKSDSELLSLSRQVKPKRTTSVGGGRKNPRKEKIQISPWTSKRKGGSVSDVSHMGESKDNETLRIVITGSSELALRQQILSTHSRPIIPYLPGRKKKKRIFLISSRYSSSEF
jgi:hypothetical protein